MKSMYEGGLHIYYSSLYFPSQRSLFLCVLKCYNSKAHMLLNLTHFQVYGGIIQVEIKIKPSKILHSAIMEQQFSQP